MTSPLGHIGLTVPDLDAAVRWYADTFGFELIMGPVEVTVDNPRIADQLREVFGRDVRFRQAHMVMGNGVALELFEFDEPETRGSGRFDYWNVGLFHICMVDPDIETLAMRIEAAGGRRRTPVREIFPGEPYRFCYCEDPYGNIVELATHPHAEAFGGRERY
jgi:catechol 2,3-dioxygenase-like lactoylglutathione lyase family enzyme